MPQPRNNEPGSVVVPKIYKCLSWGSIEDCLGFLMRRAVENASAAERIKEGVSVVKRELREKGFKILRASSLLHLPGGKINRHWSCSCPMPFRCFVAPTTASAIALLYTSPLHFK